MTEDENTRLILKCSSDTENTGEIEHRIFQNTYADGPESVDRLHFDHKVRIREFRIRLWQTFAVFWMHFSMGACSSLIGATFPDLRLIIGKDLETASWLFTINSVGFIFGATIGGLLFEKVNRHLLIGFGTLACFITITALPSCSSISYTLVVMSLNGLFTGVVDVGGNALVVAEWGKMSGPCMQAIHFGFSLGGLISPITADPFLAPLHCHKYNNTNTYTSRPYNVTFFSSIATETIESSTFHRLVTCEYGETKIQYSYLIFGICYCIATILFMAIFLVTYRQGKKYRLHLEDNDDNYVNTGTKHLPVLRNPQKAKYLVLLVILFCLIVGTEASFARFLTTFVSEHIGLSTTDGLHLTSLFWGTFAIGRLCGIPITRHMKTQMMLSISLIVLTVSLAFFWIAAMYKILVLIWTSAALIGLSMSMLFALVFTWTTESIVEVTGVISAIILASISVFNMILPLVYGYLMEAYTQMYFAHLLLAQGCLSIMIFIVICYLMHRNFKQ